MNTANKFIKSVRFAHPTAQVRCTCAAAYESR
jgi:hypothetical protein